MTEERQRHRVDAHAACDRHDRGQDLACELHVRGEVEQVVGDADHDDHRRPHQDAVRLLVVRQERQPRREHAAKDRETTEPRRRELV